MAQAFPASRFVGSDYHAASIGTAVERAADGRGRRPDRLRGGPGILVQRLAATTW